jgi:hypothetical protein
VGALRAGESCVSRARRFHDVDMVRDCRHGLASTSSVRATPRIDAEGVTRSVFIARRPCDDALAGRRVGDGGAA